MLPDERSHALAQLTPEGVQNVLRRSPQPASGARPERRLQHWAITALDLTLERAHLLVTLRSGEASVTKARTALVAGVLDDEVQAGDVIVLRSRG